MFQPLEGVSPAAFYGRCFMLLALAVWSWYLIGYDYRGAGAMASFMHSILLPIHEAGHVLFMPFGSFMMVLGGSLFQFAFPLGIGIAFIVVNGDNFGAALGAWWASVSLLDLAPYIYDALRPQLITLSGRTGADGPHDWIYLLEQLGQRHNAQHFGAWVHGIGGVLVVCTLVWAAIVLWRQYGNIKGEQTYFP